MTRKVALEPHAGQSLGATLSGRTMKKRFYFSYSLEDLGGQPDRHV